MVFLERLVPGKTGVQLAKKIIFDQGIFTPPLISTFFTINECKNETHVPFLRYYIQC
jgi:hypothetical protein